jgi:hypothetical protein
MVREAEQPPCIIEIPPIAWLCLSTPSAVATIAFHGFSRGTYTVSLSQSVASYVRRVSQWYKYDCCRGSDMTVCMCRHGTSDEEHIRTVPPEDECTPAQPKTLSEVSMQETDSLTTTATSGPLGRRQETVMPPQFWLPHNLELWIAACRRTRQGSGIFPPSWKAGNNRGIEVFVKILFFSIV